MSDVKHRFRMAMAKHLGKVITPEVAAEIEVEALYEPDRSIDPFRFDVVRYGDYIIRVESFREILDELLPLHAEHWLETERWRHGLALNPNYEALFLRERLGRLIQFTVRRDGELVGHLRMFTGRSLHTSTVFADEDTLFIRVQRRGGWLVMALMRYAERCLVNELRVREIRCNSKVVNRAGVLMKRLGYTHVADQFVKLFEENEYVQ